MDYLESLLQGPHFYPYGQQKPHEYVHFTSQLLTVNIYCSSLVGIFSLAQAHDHPLPRKSNNVTCETIHPSVLEYKSLRPDLVDFVNSNPDVFWELKPFEKKIRAQWNGKEIALRSFASASTLTFTSVDSEATMVANSNEGKGLEDLEEGDEAVSDDET